MVARIIRLPKNRFKSKEILVGLTELNESLFLFFEKRDKKVKKVVDERGGI